MTEQEFDKMKWRLTLIRSIDDRHYEVYKSVSIPDLSYTKMIFLKDGKTVRAKIVKYEFRGRVYTKQKLLEALNNEQDNTLHCGEGEKFLYEDINGFGVCCKTNEECCCCDKCHITHGKP